MLNVGKTKSLNTLCQAKKLCVTLKCAKTHAPSEIAQENENSVRINEVGVQMINEKLRRYLFGLEKNTSPKELVEKSRKHLNSFDLNKKQLDSFIRDVDNIELPKLRGRNLEEHFKNIGNEQTHVYRKLICSFAANPTLPKMPTTFHFKSGWTK